MKLRRPRGITVVAAIVALFAVNTVIAQPNEPPVANAGGPYTGDTSAPVLFNGTASFDPDGFVDTLVWDFGDGTPTFSGPTASHTYANTGSYTVTLVVTDDGGLTDTNTTTATISDGNLPPTADAGGPYRGTVNLPINFDAVGSDDPDGSITDYAWDFGDGSNGSGETVDHAYANVGVYDVVLTVTDDDGLVDSDTTTVYAGVDNFPPTADAGGPYSGVAGTAVMFDGNGSADVDGAVDTMVWDFGDGATASGAIASHTYATDGTYAVTLIVTDNESATGTNTTSAVIGVADQPPVADAGGPYSGIEGVEVIFDAGESRDDDGSITDYAWNFGDGNSGSGVTANHTYSAAGPYDVTLTVTDDDGLTNMQRTFAIIGPVANQLPTADAGGPYTGLAGDAVFFDGSDSTDDDGFIATLVWDFGDGSPTFSGNTASHTYTNAGLYTVILTVTDDDGATDSAGTLANIIEPLQPPMANPGGPYGGKAEHEVTFDGTASTDLDGVVVSYDWQFGDGNVGSGEMPTHTYATPGVYRVSLTVTDDDGLTSTNGTAAVIAENNLPPTADHGGPYNGSSGIAVLFDGTGSTDDDGVVETLVWDFGDGSAQVSGATASHTYTAGGVYSVTLTVEDDDGATDTSVTTATIAGSPTLSIELGSNAGEVTISWSPATAGFVLQETTDVGSNNWTDSPSGSTNPVTLSTGGTAKFFQLRD